MLEKPGLPDEQVAACLSTAYGLCAVTITFLPLGADQNTAVYRVVPGDGTPYFLKLRRGAFETTSVTLPRWYHEQGITQVIAPLPTRQGHLHAQVDEFTAILYPFVEGRDAYALPLSDAQWRTFGTALRRIHDLAVPSAIASHIPRESYPATWRDQVSAFAAAAGTVVGGDQVAREVAALLVAQRAPILWLVARAGALAAALQARDRAYVVCHSDLHAGNLHITPGGALLIVDWDNPILAPRERDLMYPGAGLFGGVRTPQAEETLFYAGYGAVAVDPVALAYYRYERIIQDIAAYCAQLLHTIEGSEDRVQSLQYLASNFLPDGTIAIARAADRAGG